MVKNDNLIIVKIKTESNRVKERSFKYVGIAIIVNDARKKRINRDFAA